MTRVHMIMVVSTMCLLFNAADGLAAATLVGTTTNPTGINGLVVEGVEYNVSFSIVSYNDTFGPFTPTFFGNETGVNAATAALANALNDLGVTGLNGRIQDGESLLSLSVPFTYFQSGQINEGLALQAFSSSWSTSSTGGCSICNVTSPPNPGAAWAVFAPPPPNELFIDGFESGE